MKLWDVVDTVYPNVKFTESRASERQSRAFSLSSPVRLSISVLTVVLAAGTCFYASGATSAAGSSRAQEVVAVKRGPKRSVPPGDDRDTMHGRSSSKLAKAFGYVFAPAKAEADLDKEDIYHFD
jgi:hypothetical protein